MCNSRENSIFRTLPNYFLFLCTFALNRFSFNMKLEMVVVSDKSSRVIKKIQSYEIQM